MKLSRDPGWVELERLATVVRPLHLRTLFADDPQRFARLSLRQDGWLLDYSKQRVTVEVMAALRNLWQAADVPGWIARMRAGEAINHTENRAVLHTALREAHPRPEVAAVLARMEDFCAQVHGAGHLNPWRGATGEPIRHVVNIGIGGSDLGPRMATQALAAYRVPHLDVHYVANLDGAHLATTLARCDPAHTLFVIASKTFTTQETMQNAASARAWLVAALGEAAVQRHFVAVSTNLKAVAEFGIDPANTFEFWDWVGGRFSLWSAIGLPLALAVGMDNFRQLLAGGAAMDAHFFDTPVDENLPATLALLDLWNSDFLGAETRALLPYSQSLESFPRYIQQLEMESNGKRVDREGQLIEYPTAAVVWGEPGTNGQHAFYQLIHQEGRLIPCEFIATIEADFALPGHHEKLLAHCFAQSEALMRGRTLEEAAAVSPSPTLTPYKVFPGNQPSTTLLLPRLDPQQLGRLIALYEHKVFTLGVLWNLNSFDQWGVEYGKELAGRLLPMVEGRVPVAGLDSSTAGLVNAAQRKR